MNGDILDDAIRAHRENPEPGARLSPGVRAGVIDRALRQGRERRQAFSRLFPVWPRWAAAAAPLAVLAGAVWLGMAPDVTGPSRAAVSLQASKVGDEVVFTIVDGGGKHRIVKSDRPDRFEASGTVHVARGRFADRMGAGPDLVFYKVD